jgi:predicted GTPase
MTSGPAIALIDGVHHPAAVRDALDRVERERGLAGVVFCGGEAKVTPDMLASPERHWGRPVVAGDPDEALRGLAANSRAAAVVDLADEPVLVAVFSTGAGVCADVEPVVTSQALSNREELERDLERAAREGCDVYLTELKAAAIDTVARRARERGARVVLVRNRPVGIDGDLDDALLGLSGHADTS